MAKEDQAIKINTLEIMMEQNTKDHEAIKSMILAFGDKLEESLERMETRFAAKWVEKVLIWAGSAIGVVVIGYLIRWVALNE